MAEEYDPKVIFWSEILTLPLLPIILERFSDMATEAVFAPKLWITKTFCVRLVRYQAAMAEFEDTA